MYTLYDHQEASNYVLYAELNIPAGQSNTTKLYLTFSFLQRIMKRLIKRFILKAQLDKESDEINEGKEWHVFVLNLF